jgi:hypothetical protein
MPRISRIAIGLMAFSLLAALPTFAAIPGTLPPVQTRGVVTYVSGGIGPKEAQAFEAAARQYPLDLEFAITHTPRAKFTAKDDTTAARACMCPGGDITTAAAHAWLHPRS